MPSRTISEAVTHSRSLAQLSLAAEGFFFKLWTVADSFGRTEADPELLLPRICSRRIRGVATSAGEWVDVEAVRTWINELAASNHVRVYLACGGKLYLEITPETWRREQRQYADAKPKTPRPAPGLWKAKAPLGQSLDHPFPELAGSPGESPGVPGSESARPVDSGNSPGVPAAPRSRARPLRSSTPTPTPDPYGVLTPTPSAGAEGDLGDSEPTGTGTGARTGTARRTPPKSRKSPAVRRDPGSHDAHPPGPAYVRLPTDPGAPDWTRVVAHASRLGIASLEAEEALHAWQLGEDVPEPTDPIREEADTPNFPAEPENAIPEPQENPENLATFPVEDISTGGPLSTHSEPETTAHIESVRETPVSTMPSEPTDLGDFPEPANNDSEIAERIAANLGFATPEARGAFLAYTRNPSISPPWPKVLFVNELEN